MPAANLFKDPYRPEARCSIFSLTWLRFAASSSANSGPPPYLNVRKTLYVIGPAEAAALDAEFGFFRCTPRSDPVVVRTQAWLPGKPKRYYSRCSKDVWDSGLKMTSSDPPSTVNSKGKNVSTLLRMCLSISAIIIISNFVIGTFTPTTVSLNDEITFLDMLWRVVVGQRVGSDYHNPMGFGPYQVGALLWHWLGPHNYIMRAAITLFSLAIAFCGCIVAQQTLVRRPDLALLFCVALAFQLSAPTVYPDSAQLGIMAFYNRLSASALAVLFLKTFGSGSFTDGARDRLYNAIDVMVTAFLLNVLFLIKISSFLLGLIVMFAGCAIPGRFIRQAMTLSAAFMVFAAISAIEFKLAGLEFFAVIQEYAVAARARSGYSIYDVVESLVNVPMITSLALLVMFAASQRPRPGEQRLGFQYPGVIVGSYMACQFALNMTNSGRPTMWLAPAAAASLAICMNAKAPAWQAGGSESWWRRLHPYRLGDIRVREASLLLIFVLVLFRQVLGSIFGILVAALIALEIKVPHVVSAGKQVGFWVYSYRSQEENMYAKSLNDAVSAIDTLNLGQKSIATLDHANPFPVLFLAPPPKGIHAWFDWGYNIPEGVVLDWHDVIGDACVVMIPGQPVKPYVTFRLVDSVRSKLVTDFEVVYQSASWTIYRQTRDCGTAPRP